MLIIAYCFFTLLFFFIHFCKFLPYSFVVFCFRVTKKTNHLQNLPKKCVTWTFTAEFYTFKLTMYKFLSDRLFDLNFFLFFWIFLFKYYVCFNSLKNVYILYNWFDFVLQENSAISLPISQSFFVLYLLNNFKQDICTRYLVPFLFPLHFKNTHDF